jgi:hypothetical protein
MEAHPCLCNFPSLPHLRRVGPVARALAAGDKVVRRGTDELRDGMPIGGAK